MSRNIFWPRIGFLLGLITAYPSLTLALGPWALTVQIDSGILR